MDLALLILLALLFIAIVTALWKGRWPLLFSGLKQTGSTFKSMWLRILLGMTLGGFIQVLIDPQWIADWLGPTSGLKGILIGSYAGIIMGGGPYVILPIIASIYKAGAGAGPVIALLIGGTLNVQGLITWQIPLLGAKIALTRYFVCFFVPPLVGFAGGAVYQLLNLE